MHSRSIPLFKAVAAGVFFGLAAVVQAQIGTPVDIGSNQNENGPQNPTLIITTTQAVPAGASIIVISDADSGPNPDIVSCSDGANTYSIDVRGSILADAGETAICSSHGIAAQLAVGSQIVVSWSGGDTSGIRLRAHAYFVTGLAVAPLDKTASNVGASATASSGATAPTTEANELLIGAVAVARPVSNTSFTPGVSGSCTYSNLGSAVGPFGPTLNGEFCVVSAAGAYEANGSFSGTGGSVYNWSAVLATYKGACQPPTINTVSASPNVLWPPNHKFVPVTISPSFSGGCAAVACSIKSVTSSEPPASDATSNGEAVVTPGSLVVQLLADRNATRVGTGNGRVYTVTVQCTDGTGSATKSTTVLVPHDQGH